MIFWYCQISQSATVPTQKQHGFWVLSTPEAHLPLFDGDACPQETLPRLTIPLLSIHHAWVTVTGMLIMSALPLWHVGLWAGKCLGGSSDGTPHGPITLFPVAGSPLGPPSVCKEHQLPLTGGFLVSPRAFGTH